MLRKKIPAAPGYPLFGWTRETIKKYVIDKPLQKGDFMIIYNSHGGLHHYQLALVEAVDAGPTRRVYLSKAGSSGGISFQRSGLNAAMPKGQTVMIPPVSELLEHLALDADAYLDLMPYR